MYKLPATHNEDIAYFGTLIDDFNNGNIEPVKFKGTRVPMGIYEQRRNGTYMMRIRCTGGYISPDQLLQLALTAQTHQSELLHLTTRQEIQIHNIAIDQAKSILPELQEVGLSSKGGGGNTVRNIMVDINSGISASGVFDVLPYAADLTTRLISEPDSFTLPRKLKIAFSASEANTDFAVINDLGFIAKIKDGKRGFKVYLGCQLARMDAAHQAGIVPVISPLAAELATGKPLNINADLAAAALAKELRVAKLVYLSDVPGLMGDPSKPETLIKSVNRAQADAMIADGTISGGMIPKIKSALDALNAGVRKVHFIDGRLPHALLLEIFTETGIGTEVTR